MNRRELLGAVTAGLWAMPAALGREAAAVAARHALDAFELFRVEVNHRGDWLLLRTRTASGLTGLGDASHGGDDQATRALLVRYQSELRGRSVFALEELRRWSRDQIARHGRPAMVATSAIEQSLWDLQGKALGVPTYELLGGRLRDRVRQYANINRVTTERTPEGFARSAELAVAAGFDAVKMAPFDGLPAAPGEARSRHLDQALASAAAVRRALGPERDLLIDVHSLLTVEEALELLPELAALDLYWLEEATAAEPLAGLETVNRAAPMPTAGGEAIHGLAAFHRYAAGAAVDVLMPDVKWCGGLLELRKIAAVAEAMGLEVSPHGPASPVGNVAAAQLCAALPNFALNELAFAEAPWRAQLLDPPESFERGRLLLSDRPGFGVELDEETARRHGG